MPTQTKSIATKEQAIVFFLQQKPLPPRHLQRLLYLSYAWGLVLLNDELPKDDTPTVTIFDATFVGGVLAPLELDVERLLRPFGLSPISYDEYEATRHDTTDLRHLHADAEAVFNQIWDVYGLYNANQLISIVREDKAWKNARDGVKPYITSHRALTIHDMYHDYVDHVAVETTN